VLKDESSAGGLKKSRLRSTLVVAQMAVCVVLLAGAALCVRSLMNANAIDAGFETHHIALATLDPGALGYTPAKINDFYARLLKRVEHLPGVNSASYAQFLPLGTSHSVTFVGRQAGKDPNAVMADEFRVEPGFFRTIGIPLRGRDLTQMEADADKPDAVVINETLAQRMWPGEDPIGKPLALRGEKAMSQVVGVVKNGKYRTLGEAPAPAVFHGQVPPARTLVVHTAGDSRTLLNEIRREVPIVDPLMAATDVQTIEQFMALPLFPARTVGWLLGVSGILAVLMTAIGLFGVIAYMVSQRTHEIGVRMALGARQSDVMKMVMGQGLRLTAIGLGIGFTVALGASRLLSRCFTELGQTIRRRWRRWQWDSRRSPSRRVICRRERR
jgi:predicted permease